MALHEINIALGPEATINMLLEKYPERHFLKYKSLDDHRKFMLLDVSGEKTVFQSGLNYRFIQTLGEVELSENAILYKTALQLINKKMAALKYAATEGR